MTGLSRITDCAADYVRAQAQHDTCDLGSVHAVLAARVALADCLVATGWIPPAHLVTAIEQDRTVLALTAFGLDDKPPPAPTARLPGQATIDLGTTPLPQQR